MLVASCQHSLTSYVNPFIGTDGHGHTFPGAILPYGMVQVSPDTRLDGWDGCSGYHYSDDTIYGFSHTHLSGTGCSDYGDLLLMPFTSEDKTVTVPDSLDYSLYLSSFSHRNEKAEPGYYRVVLDRNRVMAELTVHGRTALHRYTYPNIGKKGLVIDLKHRDVVINSSIHVNSDSNTMLITGHRVSAAWNPEQHFYFAMKIDGDIDNITLYKNGFSEIGIDGQALDLEGRTGINGQDCKALVSFAKEVKEVTVYVGISAVDEEGAINNLKQSEGVSFQQAKKEASEIWERALGQIEVEGGSKEDRTNFYTALYHCMTSPYLYSDADGRYRTKKVDDTTGHLIRTTEKGKNIYTVFSLWDTYRALHPLLNITDPERSTDFVRTMLSHYHWPNNGELTMWELGSHETHCMIGYHAVPVILDAYRCGVLKDLSYSELEELLDGMIATANLPKFGRNEYARDGFLSSEYDNESVSKTLEYAYDDWCIAEFARLWADDLLRQNYGNSPNHEKDSLYYTQLIIPKLKEYIVEYMNRSQSWKNIIDKDGFMHPRRNGGFLTPFNPTEVNNHFTEANSWQYSSYVPHDVYGWIKMLGGDEAAELFLDSLFYGTSELSGRDQSDITGLIGQYAHGNEPSHHAAYLYAYVGKQYKTAELVRRICTELYHDTPDGLCGNEDCGQMSAWYVLSAMGFYPLCPGSGQYIIGSPLFDKVTIHLPSGKDIVINAKGQSKKNCYVQSLRIDGTRYDNSYITIEQLQSGCTLDFEMGSNPNKEWASATERRPLNFNTAPSTFTAAPVFCDWQQSFNGDKQVSITAQDTIFYTTDGSTPTTSSHRYNGPIYVDNDVTIKAVAYNESTGYSAVITQQLTRMAKDRSLKYITKPAPQYFENGETGLIDRLHGTENYRIGGWQGWQGDCEVVIDLLEPRNISRVTTECLENMRSWIFFPTRVIVEISDDGTTFRPFGTVENNGYPATLERQENSTVADFTVTAGSVTTRYIRVKAVNFGKLPAWHISAGEQAWLFVDEITVE